MGIRLIIHCYISLQLAIIIGSGSGGSSTVKGNTNTTTSTSLASTNLRATLSKSDTTGTYIRNNSIKNDSSSIVDTTTATTLTPSTQTSTNATTRSMDTTKSSSLSELHENIDNVTVTISGNITETYEGEATELVCSVTEYTNDTITWSLDSMTLYNTTRRYILQDCTDDSCTSALYITDISDQYDEGNYTCAVNNLSSKMYGLAVYQNPIVTISPQWSSVLLGSTVNITCRVTNCEETKKVTAGNFAWCTSDLVYTILRTEACFMEISAVVTDLNNSTISCGVQKCSANLTVNVYETVTISGMLTETDEGESTQLMCTVIPRTDDIITWSLDGVTLYNTTRRYILQDCTEDICTSTLYITAISDREDEGNYSCAMNNQSSGMYALTVYQTPNITISPTLSVILLGTSANFTCHVNNCDEIDKTIAGNFTWCPADFAYTIRRRDSCMIEISTVPKNMNIAKISCGLQECTGSATTVLPFVIVTMSGTDTSVHEGETTQMTCTVLPVTDDPIAWSLNGATLQNTTRRFSLQTCHGGSCTSILYITDVSYMDDEGTYRCHVNYQPSKAHNLTVYPHHPSVIISPLWSSVLTGSSVNVTCSINNCEEVGVNSTVNFTWCPADLEYIVLRNDSCQMEISAVITQLNNSTISCGIQECSKNMTVKTFEIVTISGMTMDTYVGETTQLMCNVLPRTDENITWSLNGITLYNTTRRYILQDCTGDNCTSTLYIRDISDVIDEGNYSCSTYNQHSSNYALNVYQTPGIAIIPQWSSVLLGSSVNITCSINNCGDINKKAVGNFTWCPSDLSYSTLKTDTCVEEISAAVTDLGNLAVSCGIQECSQNITINIYEIVAIFGMVTETDEGESTQLMCIVIPRTDDNITWILDGVTLYNKTRRYILQDCTEDSCTSTLYITDISEVHDEGYYSCEVNNQSSTTFGLTVYQNPEVTISPQWSSVLLGSTVNITCNINNCDEINQATMENFTWCPSDLEFIVLRTDTCKMEVSAVITNLYNSTISCGIQECSQDMTVKAFEIVTISGIATETDEGESTQLMCTVTPRTDDIITWSLDGVTLYNTSRRYILQDCTEDNCISILYITDISDQYDEGNYSCVVYNQTSPNYSLTVYQTPNITISPQSSLMLLGSTINITCSVINCNEINQTTVENFTWCPSDLSFTIQKTNTCAMEISALVTDLGSSKVSCGILDCSKNMTIYGYSLGSSYAPSTYSLSISANTSSPVEGEALRMTCNATPRTDSVSWSKDGITLSNSTRRYITHECSEIACTSSMYILNTIALTDKGNYSCKVNDQASEVYMMTVYQKPTITLRPEPTSVMKNENVSVTCSISNCDKIDESVMGNFTWCPNGMPRTITEKSKCKMKISLNVKSLKVSGSNDYSIACGIDTCSASSTINVYTPGDDTCDTNEENGITWYKTSAGTTITQDCPEGYVGKATRLCNDQGSWDKSDISGCESEKLQEVAETLQKLEKIEIDAAGLNSVLESVNTFVTDDISGGGTENAGLEENNVVKSAEILNKISSANFTITDAKQANKTAQNFIGIADNLLKNDKTEKLKDKDKKKDTAKNLIKSIDNLGEKLSKGIRENETISITKSNIVVLIQKVEPKKVEFPDPKTPDKTTGDTSKLTVDENTLKKLAKNQNKKGIAFTAVKYTSLGSLLDSFAGNASSSNRTVNSDILSLSIHGVVTKNLDPPVHFVFKNYPRNVSKLLLNCSYLDLAESKWEFEGCKTLRSANDEETRCSCSHLTNFAILMSPVDTSEAEYERLRFISLVGCSLSIAGGVLTIAIYIHFWRYVKSRRSVLVINLCVAMITAYLLFLVAVEQSENRVACVVIAALLHYLFLSMFCHMLSFGIDLAIAILQVYKSRSSSVSLLLLGWGAPLVIVAITMGSTQLDGYGDERFCWLRHNTLYGFIVPVLAIITINIIIVIAVMRRMYTAMFMEKKSRKQKAISGVRSMATLLPVMGLTWVFGILSVNSDMVFFQYLFSIFNSIQGLFIFIFHCVFNISIRKAFRNSVRRFDMHNSSGFQKTSKDQLVSRSNHDFKSHSDEMLDKDPPKSAYSLTRPKVMIGHQNQTRENNRRTPRFSDNSSFFNQRNTHF